MQDPAIALDIAHIGVMFLFGLDLNPKELMQSIRLHYLVTLGNSPILAAAGLGTVCRPMRSLRTDPCQSNDGNISFWLLSASVWVRNLLTMFNSFVRQDPSKYTGGIRRYALAKSEFDGLIARMNYDIIQCQPFDRSEQFQVPLEHAVVQCMAFIRHVDGIIGALGSGRELGS